MKKWSFKLYCKFPLKTHEGFHDSSFRLPRGVAFEQRNPITTRPACAKRFPKLLAKHPRAIEVGTTTSSMCFLLSGSRWYTDRLTSEKQYAHTNQTKWVVFRMIHVLPTTNGQSSVFGLSGYIQNKYTGYASSKDLLHSPEPNNSINPWPHPHINLFAFLF